MAGNNFFIGPGAYDEVEFPTGGGDRPFAAITMVTTADGAVSPPASNYPRVGGLEDQQTYRRLRIHFDAVLRGARTVGINLDRNLMNPLIVTARREHGRDGPPLMGIVTNSGHVDPNGAIFKSTEYPHRVLVFAPEAADIAPELADVAEVVRVGGESVDLASVYSYLGNERAVRRIVCEGGPTLNHALIGHGLADEYLLTVSPRIYGQVRPRTAVEGAAPYPIDDLPEMTLVASRVIGDHAFLRYRFLASPFGGEP